MGRSTEVSGASVPKQGTRQSQKMGSYVYGVVLANTKLPDEQGLGDPAGKVRLIKHDEIAAVVSPVNVEQPLGRPGDFMAHARLLDSMIAKGPVLPFRFGGVLASPEAVVEELLEPHHDDFLSALDQIKGHAQYVLKGRYVEQALIAEILAENPEAGALREAMRGKDEDATRNERIRLGEIIAASIEMKRNMDTQVAVEALDGTFAQAAVREPTHEQDAVHLAMLSKMSDHKAIEKAVKKLGERWSGRVQLRLLGPLAPYDFVTAQG
ncbi:Gas vesicle synthesis protein GvpL/GvpF [Nonomuraea solani]|uniref:Gas vesicle synthesis protein GvpL/GvpF n=1 Tax=Nonomuraea solani TaxID=1144553 RepID=A0A1H6ERZ6_9ACTN|nr:GvpL/GvpF family gas vesicle protein [Nonomuraea solani]SEG99474.1 Gas vesicle synthesis protein GvpL/GvpF [Nonomuraea solani]